LLLNISMTDYSKRLAEEKGRLKLLLEAAQDELLRLMKERRDIEMRIPEIQRDISYLAPLCGAEVSDPVKELGVTDAVRYVLARAGIAEKSLTAKMVKEVLDDLGFDFSGSKNPIATIHTILGRLVRYREIEPTDRDKVTFFKWIGGDAPTLPVPQSVIDGFRTKIGKPKEVRKEVS
jgi:hypothetical protein